MASETGTVMARAFNRPQARSRRMLLGEAHCLGVATRVRRHRSLRHHATVRGRDDRERVPIAMGVDADHVVQFVCKHPADPPTRRVRWTPV
jgi:hypothetical protein